MTYKSDKGKTVAHQKISLFPIRDFDSLKYNDFRFGISSGHLVHDHVRPDINIWAEIEKAAMIREKCGELQ